MAYPFKQEIILKLKEAGRLRAEVYPFKQKKILKLKEAERLRAVAYPFKQKKILELKEADHCPSLYSRKKNNFHTIFYYAGFWSY